MKSALACSFAAGFDGVASDAFGLVGTSKEADLADVGEILLPPDCARGGGRKPSARPGTFDGTDVEDDAGLGKASEHRASSRDFRCGKEELTEITGVGILEGDGVAEADDGDAGGEK